MEVVGMDSMHDLPKNTRTHGGAQDFHSSLALSTLRETMNIALYADEAE